MTGLRIALGVVGVVAIGYGVGRLLLGLPVATLLVLGAWLLVVLLLHHGVLQPAVLQPAVPQPVSAAPDCGGAGGVGGAGCCSTWRNSAMSAPVAVR